MARDARLAFSAGLLSTLLALPVSAAIVLPNAPLTTASRLPPNVLFILDDSGSMKLAQMDSPDIARIIGGDINSTSSVDGKRYGPEEQGENVIYDQSYVTNTIYYNPARQYGPWLDSNGNPLIGGTSYNNVYIDDVNVENKDAGTKSQTKALGVSTFYVPKDLNNTSAEYLSNATNYYRYQIRDSEVIRSERKRGIWSGSSGDSGLGCSTSLTTDWGWRDCVEATPTGRSAAEEMTNFATWYSYYRTRTKAAKASASIAFAGVGTDVRVGFRTILRKNGVSGQNNPSNDVPIPVRHNNGLFDNPNGASGINNNRARWYNRLFSAAADGGTPLLRALDDAGKYYSGDANTGAYGPESGTNQYACRQNFSILTTDGYWNGDNPKNIGNADGEDGKTITGPGQRPYQYKPISPYKDDHISTLADFAMHYWKTDLRDNLDNIVPTSSADPAFWQHMVTFGISIGLKGTLDPEKDLPALRAGNKKWPKPIKDDITTIDDLWHAAINGRGTFLAAANPDEFTRGLQAALSAVTERNGSSANVTATSTELLSTTRIFQASYTSGTWSGEVLAYPTQDRAVSDTPLWRASEGIPNPGSRKVYTFDENSRAVLPFPTQIQRDKLKRDLSPAVSGEDNAAYIKGERKQEAQNGGELRNRTSVLGDIVSSSPVYVAATDTVYFGGNDGMLHAVDAANGRELFGYVPRGIDIGILSTLSSPTYSHNYFVDGPVVVSTKLQTPGENILIGALGKGGKGVFALDVTKPEDFSKVKWDNTGSTNPNMGLVQSRPVIARLNNGTTAVIVSNGLNSTNERAVLMIYNLETGDLIREIDTGAGSASSANGLSSATGWDADGNGTVDYVYAGDMLGNVWKFDLSSTAKASWNVANSGKALFTTPVNKGVTQPITGGITVAMHPSTYKTWVFFGTGRLMTVGDMTNKDMQAMYGLMDEGAQVLKRELTERSIQVATTSNGLAVRAFQANAPLPQASKGWFINLLLPSSNVPEGERVITEPQVVNRTLTFSSVIPTADACLPDGRGYINSLDAFTGTGLATSYFDLNNNGSFADEVVQGGNGKDLPIGSVDLRVGMPTQVELLRGLLSAGGSGGRGLSVSTADHRNVGRVSWREIIRD